MNPVRGYPVAKIAISIATLSKQGSLMSTLSPK